MRIQFRRLSDQQHELAIVRADGRRESVTCETRSMFLHDLIHYAVEGAAGIGYGFWGSLARGRTLADMNDRARDMPAFEGAEMATVEQFVGALHGAAKGLAAADVIAGIERYVEAMDATMPAWLTEALVVSVQERLRRLVGAWRATPHGGTMEVEWPPAAATAAAGGPSP
jgi:hypothetical protein